jgi:PAS domain S-box-containing protein
VSQRHRSTIETPPTSEAGPPSSLRPQEPAERGPPNERPRPGAGAAIGEISVDLTGAITDLTGAIEELTGYSREELIGRPFQSCFLEPARAEHAIRQALAGERVLDRRLGLSTRSRVEVIGSCDFRSLRGPAGSLLGVAVTLYPAEDRGKPDPQRRASTLYHRGLIEASPDALFVIDPQMHITDVRRWSV